MTIEKANSNDYKILTEITKKSKAFWGYSDAQIEIWSSFLTITEEYIETKSIFKLIVYNEIVGYYSYFYESKNNIKLDNLFILPEFIGKGFGKVLMLDFFKRLENSTAEKVTLDSEPNAENFYLKFGFVTITHIETSIKDRFMPIMEFKLSKKKIEPLLNFIS